MKLKRVLYVVPLLLVSVCFAVVAVHFKEGQRRAEATRKLVRLCEEDDNENYLQRASTLLHAGANPDARDTHGNPLLFDADAGLTQNLVAAGATVDIRGSHGLTPLMKAAGQSGEDAARCVRILMRAGANPNLLDERGNSALLMASQLLTNDFAEGSFLNPDVARFLLAQGHM